MNIKIINLLDTFQNGVHETTFVYSLQIWGHPQYEDFSHTSPTYIGGVLPTYIMPVINWLLCIYANETIYFFFY